MARQTIPYTLEPRSYPDPKLAPMIAAVRWVQENVTDHSQVLFTGRESIHVKNNDTAVNEVQDIATDSGTVTNGFTIATIPVHGIDYVSAHIAYNSTPTQVQNLLLAAVDENGTAFSTRFPGGLACTGTNLPAGTVTITFKEALAGQLIDSITLANTLTGGTFAVTEDTPGDGGHTVTVPSTNDPFNRAVDIVEIVGAGTEVVLPLFQRIGWRQDDGYIYLNGDDNHLYFAAVELPAN